MSLKLEKCSEGLRLKILKQIADEDRCKIQNTKPEPPLQSESLGTDTREEGCPRRARVRFTSFRRRLITDRTNLEGGIKAIEDALVYAGLVAGDSESEITRTVKQVKVKTEEEERTEIEIESDDLPTGQSGT